MNQEDAFLQVVRTFRPTRKTCMGRSNRSIRVARNWRLGMDRTSLESLEVGAAPLVRHFLDRLGLEALLRQHLSASPRRPEALPSSVTLCALVANLLLARRAAPS
jgi:hypothetical protein